MIKCIVVDDEPLAVSLLTDYISKVPFMELVFSTVDPIEALQKMQDQKVDLVFLDIQMPGITGLQFMKIISGKVRAILITAFHEYALEGYEHNVVDYLLKPVSFDRFYKAALKAHDVFKSSEQLRESSFKSSDSAQQTMEYIFVKADNRILKILLHEILFIEGLKDYIAINTFKEKIVILENLKTMEDRLPKTKFLRVHKSHIVCLDKIDSIERNRIFISGGMVLPIGDVYKDVFFAAIKERHFG